MERKNKVTVQSFFHYGSGDYCAFAKVNGGESFRVFYIGYKVSLEAVPLANGGCCTDEATLEDIKRQCRAEFQKHDAEQQGYVD